MQASSPEEIGLSAQRLARIRPILQTYVDQGQIPGALTAITRRGRLAHLECVGLRDREARKPVEADTLFRIASLTKPITTVAVLMLYEEGHFQLDDPIARFLPEFGECRVFLPSAELVAPERPIVVHHLLTHTAGLPNPGVDVRLAELLRAADIDADENSLAEKVRKLASVPLAYHPGCTWLYSHAHDVLARLVEVVAGRPYAEFLHERVLAPLQMVDTGYVVSDEKVERLAAIYEPPEGSQMACTETAQQSPYRNPQRRTDGGIGLVSTVGDYLRFAQMLLNGGKLDGVRRLSRKSVELMTANHLAPDLLPKFNLLERSRGYYTKGYGFGLGLRVLLDPAANATVGSKGSYGWAGLWNTYFWVDPAEELIGCIWTQMPKLYYYPLERQFTALTYAAIAD